ncbi:MAG: RNA-binding transcriptional accessory protein [Saprospirales bacterium]|nr:MAG: RNA-binding transcriptional accessory protein [Saprospirales bacterium]
MEISQIIARSKGIPNKSVIQALTLFEEGATIPFVARYRKEQTGGLDEIQLSGVLDEFKRLKLLQERKAFIIKTIAEQGKLIPSLKQRILDSWSSSEIEDLYLPYKSKRKTKADQAREKGLELLAKILMNQKPSTRPNEVAEKFCKGKVKTIEEALAGARDIIAEWINVNAKNRQMCRSAFYKSAVLYAKVVKGKENKDSKYKDYYNFSEYLFKAPSHRLLAMFRGENEGVLKLKILPDEDNLLDGLQRGLIKNKSHCEEHLLLALNDAWKRLLQPSLETEFRKIAKSRADEVAIKTFANNLRQLLLAPPLGPKRILALDPAYRTGCKTVCLNESGDLLWHGTVFPHPPQNQKTPAAVLLNELVQQYEIQAIAIGNGTAGKETFDFIKSIPEMSEVQVYLVNEAGASVYSASKVAGEEFPDCDLTVRGAVSIGRRLMDPLAELVKIDPQHIGVGQYQHDVDQRLLNEKLKQEVAFCVNMVGVNLQTASKHLLAFISGLGPTTAEAIVNYRSEKAKFLSRMELLKVPGLGPKTFQQCAGFIRVPDSSNPLDNTAVHPERYALLEKMASDSRSEITDFISSSQKRRNVNLESYVGADIGMPTLNDIMLELEKPGLDPRAKAEEVKFSNIAGIEDIQVGMKVFGTISNLAKFGAFVDLGIKAGALIHISEISNNFISDPSELLSLGQQIEAKVIKVDISRKRISLSLK